MPAATDRESDPVDCVVVGVTYNNADHIDEFLDSIPSAARGLRVRCLIVDNGSRDGTVAIVRRRPEIQVIESGANLGYSGAINIARAAAGACTAMMIANPDLVLEEGAIGELFAAVQTPGIGVAVPLLLESGELFLSLRRDPTVLRSLGDALVGARLPTRPNWLSETVRDPRDYQEGRDVDWASGAALMISEVCGRAVGEWDSERFFLYSEETDFMARARDRGYRIRYVPTARAAHESGGSGRSPALAALLAVNRIRYVEKRHPRSARALGYRATVALQHLLRCFRDADRASLAAVCRRASWARLPGSRSAT